MNSRPIRIKNNIFLLFIILVYQGYGKDFNWHITTSLSGGLDNNVLESVSTPNSDATSRFIFNFRGKGLLGPVLNTQLQYQGGLETYARYSKENRTIQQLSGNFLLPVEKKIGFGIRFTGRWKAFFRDNRGYGILKISPYFSIAIGEKWMTSISYTNMIMNYEAGKNFDHEQNEYGIQTIRRINNKIKFGLQYRSGSTTFFRDAFGYEIISPADTLWLSKGISQTDHTETYSMHLEILYWALIRLDFYYEKNHSNSYGYDYTAPNMNCLMVFYLPGEFSMNLMGAFQWKNYKDSLIPILQIRPDTENEENSYFVIELSKDLTPKHTVRIRFGYYKNESPFRDQYYEKILFSAGYAFEF